MDDIAIHTFYRSSFRHLCVYFAAPRRNVSPSPRSIGLAGARGAPILHAGGRLFHPSRSQAFMIMRGKLYSRHGLIHIEEEEQNLDILLSGSQHCASCFRRCILWRGEVARMERNIISVYAVLILNGAREGRRGCCYDESGIIVSITLVCGRIPLYSHLIFPRSAR